MRARGLRLLLLCLAASLLAVGADARAVTFDWVWVAGPGNACDTQSQGCFGAVGGHFRIARHEVTNSDYAELLNAVAGGTALPPDSPDPNALYHEDMGDSPHGGILRSGDGLLTDYVYTVKAGFESRPVTFVSFWDAVRYANWLHNGQPSGPQTAATTEDGAYTITAQGVSNNSITRNAGATIFLPSEDEWYKAAYYDAATGTWYDYPAGSDTQILCATPTSAPDSANCQSAVGGLTDVGSYVGSPSPAGAFDLAGNVWEWHDTIFSSSFRTARGGSWLNDDLSTGASIRAAGSPSGEFSNQGIRVATLPEPSGSLQIVSGLSALALLHRTTRRWRSGMQKGI